MNEKISVMISEEDVDKRIKEVAQEISENYAGKSIHLICILKGSIFFMCELAKRITVPVTMDFMSVSSYGGGTQSSGIVKIVKDLDESLEGKEVLIVEDIIDSGRTLSHLTKILSERKPASLEIATLLDKPSRRVVDVDVSYTCFEVPDYFIVGYGLDYNQKYRELPYIGVVEFE
ncbi:MAG: hypoxanthine phosphoribosyltransferase [Eubacterium sp.]